MPPLLMGGRDVGARPEARAIAWDARRACIGAAAARPAGPCPPWLDARPSFCGLLMWHLSCVHANFFVRQQRQPRCLPLAGAGRCHRRVVCLCVRACGCCERLVCTCLQGMAAHPRNTCSLVDVGRRVVAIGLQPRPVSCAGRCSANFASLHSTSVLHLGCCWLQRRISQLDPDITSRFHKALKHSKTRALREEKTQALGDVEWFRNSTQHIVPCPFCFNVNVYNCLNLCLPLPSGCP